MKLTRRGFFAGIASAAFVAAMPVIKAIPQPIMDYAGLTDWRACALARSMQRTKQETAAKIYNEAFKTLT